MADAKPLFGETSYPYAVGRVKALEGTLLDRAQWGRLLEADEAQGLSLLREWGYGASAGADDLESRLRAQLADTAILLREIAPDPGLLRVFCLPVDAHNLKVLLKARLVGEKADRLLLSGGCFEKALLQVCVEVDDYSLLSPLLGERLQGAGDLTDPQALSVLVDNAVFAQMLRDAGKNELLRQYLRTQAEYTNRLSAIRASQLGWSQQQLDRVQIPIENTPPAALQDGDVREVEREKQQALRRVIAGQKDDSFGPGPLLYYRLAKEQEARALRILFAAKRAGQPVTMDDLEL